MGGAVRRHAFRTHEVEQTLVHVGRRHSAAGGGGGRGRHGFVRGNMQDSTML